MLTQFYLVDKYWARALSFDCTDEFTYFAMVQYLTYLKDILRYMFQFYHGGRDQSINNPTNLSIRGRDSSSISPATIHLTSVHFLMDGDATAPHSPRTAPYVACVTAKTDCAPTVTVDIHAIGRTMALSLTVLPRRLLRTKGNIGL